MTERLRIFLSSPGDISAIREIAAQTIDRVQRDYAHLLTIERYLWEDHAFTAAESFQDGIPLPSTFDIVVLVVGAYVAPTDNVVHDGSTAVAARPVSHLMIRGFFRPRAG